MLDHQIARDLEAAYGLSDRLEHGSIKATYNKARFAKLHWAELRQATPEMLLESFSFAYRRIEFPHTPVPEKDEIKKCWIDPIEKRLIRKFQPICNTEFRSDNDGHAARIDEVSEAFDKEFAVQPALTAVTAPNSQPIAVATDALEEIEEANEASPSDPRWSEYSTNSGQMRVRAVLPASSRKKGRTLLCRKSAKRVFCLADTVRLEAVGVKATNSGDPTLPSAVSVDFEGDPTKCAALLRKILEACLGV